MKHRWLVVEEAFGDGRAVLLKPRVVVENAFRGEVAVTLKLPDGTARAARASLMVSHVRGAMAPFGMVRLHGVAAEDVPAGTELWSDTGILAAPRDA